MASLFRRGQKGCWTIRYYDESGKRRDIASGTRDRRTAERIAGEIESRVAMRRAGLVDAREERRAAEDRRPLAEHLIEWRRHLAAGGRTEQYVGECARQVARIVDAIGAKRLSDLTPARVQQFLGERRAAGRSARTANRDLISIRSFVRWLIRDGRLASDPLVGLSGFNEATDRRHRRRALTADELGRLFAAARNGQPCRGITGPDREILYRLAAGTGFRAGELFKLRRQDFHLDRGPPTITVRAGASKHRREDVQPIRRDLADLLRPWLTTRPVAPSLFGVRYVLGHGVDLMRRDLEVAGIPYETDAGVADFHALRHTFVTHLVRSGASPKEAQTLARHSTPALTLQVYTHARLEDVAGALERMPAIAGPASSEAAQATGTGDAARPRICPPLPGGSGRVVANAGGLWRDDAQDAEAAESDNTARSDAIWRDEASEDNGWCGGNRTPDPLLVRPEGSDTSDEGEVDSDEPPLRAHQSAHRSDLTAAERALLDEIARALASCSGLHRAAVAGSLRALIRDLVAGSGGANRQGRRR